MITAAVDRDVRRTLSRRRSAAALLLVSLLLVLAACGSSSASRPATTTEALPTQEMTSLLVIGDSYAAGVGASTELRGFGPQLGRLLGVDTAVDGVSGTGFLNPGPFGDDQRYEARVLALPAEDLTRTLIVVEGGLNDRGRDPTELRAATAELLSTLTTVAPTSTVVLVGAPAPVPSDPGPSETVNAALSVAAHDAGVPFVDPVADGWFTADNARQYVALDQVHPTQAGHDHIAMLLADDLRPLLIGG